MELGNLMERSSDAMRVCNLSCQGEAKMECEEIEASQTVTADLSTFTTTGTIRGDLKGTTQFTGDATSLTPITGTVSPPLNPTFSYTGNLVITTQKGTLTTRSVGMFEIVPFGTGTQFDRVIAGTGKFQGQQDCSISPLRQMGMSVVSPVP